MNLEPDVAHQRWLILAQADQVRFDIGALTGQRGEDGLAGARYLGARVAKTAGKLFD